MKKNNFARPWEPAPEIPLNELRRLARQHGITKQGCICVPRDNGGLRVIVLHPIEHEQLRTVTAC